MTSEVEGTLAVCGAVETKRKCFYEEEVIISVRCYLEVKWYGGQRTGHWFGKLEVGGDTDKSFNCVIFLELFILIN